MNCCNDYGHCTQGHDCPVHHAPPPIQDDAPFTWDQVAWAFLRCLVFGISAVFALIGMGAVFQRYGAGIEEAFWALVAQVF